LLHHHWLKMPVLDRKPAPAYGQRTAKMHSPPLQNATRRNLREHGEPTRTRTSDKRIMRQWNPRKVCFVIRRLATSFSFPGSQIGPKPSLFRSWLSGRGRPNCASDRILKAFTDRTPNTELRTETETRMLRLKFGGAVEGVELNSCDTGSW
jgi:hypothetical protein